MLLGHALQLAFIASACPCIYAALTYTGCFNVHHPGYNPLQPPSLARVGGRQARTVASRVFPISTGRAYSALVSESPQSCLNLCKNLGYDFAGVENLNGIGTDNLCLCGDKFEVDRAQPKPNGCNTLCPNGVEKCGQTTALDYLTRLYLPEMSVYSDPDVQKRTATLEGCFVFPGVDAPVAEADLGKAVSPSHCLGHCYEVGYSAAGLNHGGDCYCGTAAQLEVGGSATDCVIRCSNGIDICGATNTAVRGPASLSVYTNAADAAINVEELGCYDSRPRVDAPRTLKVQVPNPARARETPERCVRSCNTHGFTHAGLESGNRCFCGSPSDIVTSRYVTMDNCPVACQGKDGATRSCGGSVESAITVYRNVDFTPLSLTKVGCMPSSDLLYRISRRLVVAQFQSQTPESCVNACTHNGYKYAATEYARCTCLTEGMLAKVDTKGITGCTRMCEGKTESDTYKFCGGAQVVSIYSVA